MVTKKGILEAHLEAMLSVEPKVNCKISARCSGRQ